MLDAEMIKEVIHGKILFIVRNYLSGQQAVFMEEWMAIEHLLKG